MLTGDKEELADIEKLLAQVSEWPFTKSIKSIDFWWAESSIVIHDFRYYFIWPNFLWDGSQYQY